MIRRESARWGATSQLPEAMIHRHAHRGKVPTRQSGIEVATKKPIAELEDVAEKYSFGKDTRLEAELLEDRIGNSDILSRGGVDNERIRSRNRECDY